MQPIVRDWVAWSVVQSVTAVSCAKTVEPIKMPFVLRTQAGPRNHVLGGLQTEATWQIPLNHSWWRCGLLSNYFNRSLLNAVVTIKLTQLFLWKHINNHCYGFVRGRHLKILRHFVSKRHEQSSIHYHHIKHGTHQHFNASYFSFWNVIIMTSCSKPS